MIRCLLLFFTLSFFIFAKSQTWVDSLDNYARKVYLPAFKYALNWQNAPLLRVMILQYESAMSTDKRETYFEYVRLAMRGNISNATGLLPNSVASTHGLAFMYRETGEERYLEAALKVYEDYLRIIRTSNGGVSHLFYAPELWDDTIYMVGVYLMAMYRATNDEKYIDELIFQFKAHKEKLEVEEWGLWVHGWDGDNKPNIDFCSQSTTWPDKDTRRSKEIWGRGNAWVVVTLSELLNTIDRSHKEWDFLAASLKEMIVHLPDLQDEATGHWYQLPVRKGEEGNYIESSCTAMFGFGILNALKLGIVSGEDYEKAVERAYYGLRKHSIYPVGPEEKGFLNTKNVCAETCIGDKNYYFDIETTTGKAYALAVFIMFGNAYEAEYLPQVTNVINHSNNIETFKLYPSPISKGQTLSILLSAKKSYDTSIEIVDIIGKVAYKTYTRIGAGSNQMSLPLNDMQAGKYFLTLRDKSGTLLITSSFFVN